MQNPKQMLNDKLVLFTIVKEIKLICCHIDVHIK
jgi:hypothetical protein